MTCSRARWGPPTPIITAIPTTPGKRSPDPSPDPPGPVGHGVRVLHLVTRHGPAAEVAARLAAGAAARPDSAGGTDLLAIGPVRADDCGVGRAEGRPFLPEDAFLSRLLVVRHLAREVSPWRDALAFIELVSLLAEARPAILHTHTSKAGFLGRLAAWVVNRTSARQRPVRVVHTPHGHLLYGYFGPMKSALFRMLEAAAARVTDRLVAVSEGEMRESLEAGLGRTGQWTVIPAGISDAAPDVGEKALALRERLGLPAGAFVVGTVTRLERVKGVRYLIEAAGLVLQRTSPPTDGSFPRDIRFLIVGDGSQRPGLERLARDLGIRSSVVFAGFQEDAASFLALMDAYVQPSLNEAMGRALVQALARGLPAAASSVCGIPDAVQDGSSGLLVPPADPEALARAIARLAGDPSLRKRLADGGRAVAMRKDEEGRLYFSAERMLRLHEELYAGLLAAPDRRGRGGREP